MSIHDRSTATLQHVVHYTEIPSAKFSITISESEFFIRILHDICTTDEPTACDSARMNVMKDAATMKAENKIRIFIATLALVGVATTVFLNDNFY